MNSRAASAALAPIWTWIVIVVMALGYLIWSNDPTSTSWQDLAKAIAALITVLGTLTAGL